MSISLFFAVRSLRITMKAFGYSLDQTQTVLDYYLLSPHEYAQRQALKVEVTTWIIHELNRKVREKLKFKDIMCNFCGGELGDVEHQKHDNPNFAEYRSCLKCGYQWAKEYWAWLAKEQEVAA